MMKSNVWVIWTMVCALQKTKKQKTEFFDCRGIDCKNAPLLDDRIKWGCWLRRYVGLVQHKDFASQKLFTVGGWGTWRSKQREVRPDSLQYRYGSHWAGWFGMQHREIFCLQGLWCLFDHFLLQLEKQPEKYRSNCLEARSKFPVIYILVIFVKHPFFLMNSKFIT
jgi:hypothetical protein